jgi:aspartyl-tRNA(Asn)/glutamyl-tRNA(Gln) amidotransferase subunit A
VKNRIISGAFAACSENYHDFYLKACKVRRLIKNSFDKVFETADVILMPPVSCVAFGLKDKQNQKEMWLTDLFTLPSNLAGLGGMVVPIEKDKLTGLPVGMQIISQRFQDIKMFEVGKILEGNIQI